MRERTRPSHASALPAVPAEAALSFLKDTKGALTWPAKELAGDAEDRPARGGAGAAVPGSAGIRAACARDWRMDDHAGGRVRGWREAASVCPGKRRAGACRLERADCRSQ